NEVAPRRACIMNELLPLTILGFVGAFVGLFACVGTGVWAALGVLRRLLETRVRKEPGQCGTLEIGVATMGDNWMAMSWIPSAPPVATGLAVPERGCGQGSSRRQRRTPRKRRRTSHPVPVRRWAQTP